MIHDFLTFDHRVIWGGTSRGAASGRHRSARRQSPAPPSLGELRDRCGWDWSEGLLEPREEIGDGPAVVIATQFTGYSRKLEA
jgi:hypothetical protein